MRQYLFRGVSYGEGKNKDEISVMSKIGFNCIKIDGICDSGTGALPTMKPSRGFLSFTSYITEIMSLT